MCFAVWISRSESASSVGMGSQTDAARFDRMTKKKTTPTTAGGRNRSEQDDQRRSEINKPTQTPSNKQNTQTEFIVVTFGCRTNAKVE